jgi:DNA replication protein DnaC
MPINRQRAGRVKGAPAASTASGSLTRPSAPRKVVAVALLILDDFAIDVLDAVENCDLYDLLLERYRTGSVIVTSNRGPDEWLATFADPVRAQSAIDRFTSNAYDLVIDGESYRPRLKPRLTKDAKERPRS